MRLQLETLFRPTRLVLLEMMMTRRRRALHPRLESLLLKPAKPAKPDMRSKKRRRMLATRRYLFRVISKA